MPVHALTALEDEYELLDIMEELEAYEEDA